MNFKRLLQLARGLFTVAFVAGAAVLTAAAPVAAQGDPPGRVGRIAEVQGRVSWFDDEQGQWVEAERNQPLTGGDRVGTAADGRAEMRVGSTVLRLAGSSEIEVLRLDDERLVFQLHAGSVALRVRSREVADETELLTAEARLLPQRAGHYRVDRFDDTTLAGAWRGELRVADTAWQVSSGQRIELFRDNRGADLRQMPSRFADDPFAGWVLAEDGRDSERSASHRYVSPEMTGAEELDRHGRWDQHPEHGAIWYPVVVQSDWAPYRYGRWTWVRPWGWTWVDTAPWGFAPFHYGRWVHWRNRWDWVPGAYVARPVFAPALVAWIGGGHWSASVRIGGPPVGWVPLAPREAYRPHYRHTPVYVDRVNPGPRQHWHHPQQAHRPGGRQPGWHERGEHGDRRERPWVYGNQAVPGAVTVVPGDVLLRRQPVARQVIDVQPPSGGPNGVAVQPATLAPVAPPPAPPVTVAPRVDRAGPGEDRRGERGPGRNERGEDRTDGRREVWRDDRRGDWRGGDEPRHGSRDDRRDARREDRSMEPPVQVPSAAPSAGPLSSPQVVVTPVTPGVSPGVPRVVTPPQHGRGMEHDRAGRERAREEGHWRGREVPSWGAQRPGRQESAADSATRVQPVQPAERTRPWAAPAAQQAEPSLASEPRHAQPAPASPGQQTAPPAAHTRAQPGQVEAPPAPPPRQLAPAAAAQPPRVEVPSSPSPSPSARVATPPPAAAAVLVSPPPAAAAAVAGPPTEAQRPPRERAEPRDDERKGRPQPTHRQQSR